MILVITNAVNLGQLWHKPRPKPVPLDFSQFFLVYFCFVGSLFRSHRFSGVPWRLDSLCTGTGAKVCAFVCEHNSRRVLAV